MKIDMNKFILSKYLKTDKVTDAVMGAYISIHGANGTGGRLASCQVPLDYRFVMLHNSPAKDQQEKVYSILEKYVESYKKLFENDNPLDTRGRVKSLYLWSEETGTGKTTTASALLNEFVAVNYIGSLKRKLSPAQIPAFLFDVNEFQELYNKFNRSNGPQDIGEEASREYYRRMALAESSPLVVFDDIGVRSSTEAFRGDLHSIINKRVSNQLPSIYTSNYPMEQLAEVYDKRLYDRVRDLTVPLYFEGSSQRGQR